MYNIKLAGLDTGKFYYVKVRAKVNGYETSEWSLPFQFETPRDTMPPGRIENLSFLSEGDSFIANWEAPPLNEDGSVCGDISHYRLVFKDLDNDRTRAVTTTDTSFAMDFNRNVQMFHSPAGHIELTVTAVDLSGNESKVVVAIAQNPPPAKVKNVTAFVGVEAIALNWDASTETDLLNYEIHVGTETGFTPTIETLRATIAPGTSSFTYDSSSLVRLYIKIVAVDKFNQRADPSDEVSAQPRLTTDYDREPPGAVTGLTVTQSLASDNATSVARVSFTSREDNDLDKYEIQYRKTGETTAPWSFTTVPSDESSAEIKPLPLETSYDFRIRAVDYNANKGNWSGVIVATGVKKTSLPPAPTSVIARGGLTNLMITWTASTDPSMANWAGTYEVEVAKSLDFADPIVATTSSTLLSLTNLDKNTVYYVRARSIDPYGNIGPWSLAASENTGEVEETANKNIFSADDASGVDKDGTPFINGDIWYKIDDNDDILAMWEFFDGNWVAKQVKNLAEDSVTSETISADAILARHIKAEEITGDKLAVNAAVINNLKIQSSIEINDADGHIKSSNYTADGEAGFYMDQQQLIINQGKIKAAALEIQDSQNLLPAPYAGLDHRSEFYEDTVISDDGGILYHWPGAGRSFGGALAHEGQHTTFGFSPISSAHLITIDKGEKYIVSGYIRKYSEQQTLHAVSASLGVLVLDPYTDESTEHWSDIATTDKSIEWTRVQFVFEAAVDGVASLLIKNNGSTDASDIPVWSSFQVERVVAGRGEASPWSPPGFTSIDGESITTGSISSSDTINTGNGDIARWSINTEGAARFADVTVDGKLIVGGYEEDQEKNANVSIQSDQYSEGRAGWAIKGNGDVEFNNGTFRGILNLGRILGEELRPTMTASVSSIKLYTDATAFKDIDVASIQGTMYAYSRDDLEGIGAYTPTEPDESRIARYYIGPTTDRSLNIQVHDGPEDRAVYLDDPPAEISLTSLFVGELTTPSTPQVSREKQGFGYSSTRIEKDPTSPNRRSSTTVQQRSSIQLRSPFYPETIDYAGNESYPESEHLLESSVNFQAPADKNLISSSNALPDARPISVFKREGRASYLGYAYRLLEPVLTANVRHIQFKRSLTVGKKYIFSVHVDTLDAATGVGIYALLNDSDPMNPLEGQEMPSDQLDYVEIAPGRGIQSHNGIMVPPGNEEVRIAFEYTPTVSNANSISVYMTGPLGNIGYVYKLQMESTDYQDNLDLPDDIRARLAPTPWTTDGSTSTGAAALRLRSAPATDFDSWASSSLGKQFGGTSLVADAIEKHSPVEMELDLSSTFSSNINSGDRESARAKYRWSTAGMTYPGAKSPFLPIAAEIFWDYRNLSNSAKYSIGNSTANRYITINSQNHSNGDVNIGGGVHVLYTFNQNRNANWILVGDPYINISSGNYYRRTRVDKTGPSVDFWQNTAQTKTVNQNVSLRVDNVNVIFNTPYDVNATLIANYDPATNSRIEMRYREGYRRWDLYIIESGVTIYQTGGTGPSIGGWGTLRLERNGNRITGSYGTTQLFNLTLSQIANLQAKNAGFSLDGGKADKFELYDQMPGSNAPGELLPRSVNVNNDSGISVQGNGKIVIDMAGYYMVSGVVNGDFGGTIDRTYWLDLIEPDGTIHHLGGQVNRSDADMPFIAGSAVLYLTTSVDFRICTHTTNHESLIDRAELRIVRVV